jgi:hypothetical protein
VQDPESAARSGLLRSLIIYLALFAADAAVVSWLAASSPQGAAFVPLSIIGVIGVLLGYQAYAHYRDLRSPLAESEGIVTRVWSRADLLVAWHSYYMMVGRAVFRLQPEDYVIMEDRFRTLARLDPPGDMYVKVVHFPHTLNVVSIHEILRPPTESPGGPDGEPPFVRFAVLW